MRKGQLKLVIDSRLELVRGFAGAARGFLEEMAVEEPFELELCIVEAVNNAIEHAYGSSAGSEVHVELRTDPDGAVTMTVTDGGRPIPQGTFERACAYASLQDDGDPSDLRERGMGLGLIMELLDVEYTSTGGQNRLVLRRAGRAADGPATVQ